MPRYLSRPHSGGWIEDDSYDGDEPFRPALDVEGARDVNTGLVTSTGEPIYRVPPPIGFGRLEDW